MADNSTSQLQQEAALQQFIQLASDAQVVNYTTVAGLVLLIHDIILTFPREVGHFPSFPRLPHTNLLPDERSSSYGSAKSRQAALCLRSCATEISSHKELGSHITYGLIPLMLSAKHGSIRRNGSRMSCSFQFLVSQQYPLWYPRCQPYRYYLVFLALRTYALYRGEGAFYKWLIFGVVLSSNLALFVSLSLATAEVRFSPLPAPGLTCSFTISGPPNTAGLVQFIASTYFDFVIFGLSALRCWQHYKQGNVRIIKILFKSCLLYFVFLFTTGLASLIMYKTLPDARAELKGVLINPMRTAAVIITSRMVLNIRSIVWSDGPITTENLATPFDKTTVGSASLRWRVAPGQEDPMEFDEDEY
ncbi:hypothetical protein MSAN_00353900 [Mycena sanguinolenta]|uniref:Uncharacterized protein n=1 Tax=Mycena sanguinolenta TaxID=230812 RepID=A0A8H6ZCD0_9AGAR|nr:hypothetical protein MSAN_00353900 [Mycena sanguinolenta]